MSEQKNVYYVYIHRRGDNNEVFYVGKGKGNRSKSKAGRNCWWTNIVNKYGYTAEIVEKELSESSAFELEVELIKFYRECNHKLCNLSSGGEGASGCIRSEEHKKAVSDAHKGKKHTPEAIAKIRAQGNKVICINNRMTFTSAAQAALWVIDNTKHSKARYDAIMKCCKGIQKKAFGLRWQFYEDSLQHSALGLDMLYEQEQYVQDQYTI